MLTLGLFGLCAPAWVQDRFAIGLWVDPLVPPVEFDARYAEVAEAGFTVLIGNFGAKDPESVRFQLRACHRHGLKAIIDTCGGGSQSPGKCVSPLAARSPALWGYFIYDEPNASQYDMLRDWSDEVANVLPDALRFVNLLPNYAALWQFNTSTYGE